MKQALLFLVFLLGFCRCKKAENQYIVDSQIHEINIGTSGGNVKDLNGKTNWQFFYFCHLDLVKDSVYKKINYSLLLGKEQIAEIESGKFPLKENKIIKAFTSVAASTKNQTYFKERSNSGAVCGPGLLVIEYKNGKSSKIFFFEKGNKEFSDLRNLLNSSAFDRALFPVYSPINLNDDHLVDKIRNSPFFDSLQVPPFVQKTIKFSPPVKSKN